MKGPFGWTFIAAAGVIVAAQASGAGATNLYSPSNWSAMVSDRAAQRVGDSLTVIIYETSTAQNAAKTNTKRDATIGGQIGTNSQNAGLLSMNSKFDSNAQASRSGKLVASISVLVDDILPNGDLHVSGEQVLEVGGEKTLISVKGRVRPADIGGDNTVLSTRLANARIDYNGKGFVSGGARPGVISRVFSWLGLP